MAKTKLLICGGTGFIGRNLLEYFSQSGQFEIAATWHRTRPQEGASVHWIEADLTHAADVDRAVRGQDVILHAAATTSGAKDILSKPYSHVTDNAVMSALLFRACLEHKVKHVVFLSCTVMYRPLGRPVREEDFDGHITENYFGAGWTKVYNEKMCEFYARTGPARYSVLRHSNIYGPYDKFDLEKSHVFGATITKVMTTREGDRLVVWGDGSDERDFLYVEDLMEAVAALIERQKTPFELLNVGAGRSYSVKSLVAEMLAVSGRKLEVEYDVSKPSIGFKLAVNAEKIEKLYGWKARTSLKEGIQETLAWYRQHGLPRQPSVS